MERGIPKLALNRSLALRAGAALAATAVIVLGARELRYRTDLSAAERRIGKGRFELAMESLLPHEYRLSTSAEGCALLIQAVLPAREASVLARVSERCEESGTRTALTEIAKAQSRVLRGVPREGLSILVNAATDFSEAWELHHRIAMTFDVLGERRNAALAYVNAARIAPREAPVHLEAFEYLYRIKDFDGAGKLSEAEPLRSHPDPRIAAQRADAYLRAGLLEAALGSASALRARLATDHRTYTELERAFPEVLLPRTIEELRQTKNRLDEAEETLARLRQGTREAGPDVRNQ